MLFFLICIATKRWMISVIKEVGFGVEKETTSNSITSFSKELGTTNFRFYFKTLPIPPASAVSGT